jgi:hypothetical protein
LFLSCYEIWLFHTKGSFSWLLTTEAWFWSEGSLCGMKYSYSQFTTNWSYNTNFLKKISFQISLKFHFELPSFISLKKLHSYYFAAERLLAGIPFSVPEGVRSTSFLIFNLWPIWLTYHVFLKYYVRMVGSTRSNGTGFVPHISFSPIT